MSETRSVPPPADRLAESAVRSLRFRYRAYLVVVALIAVCVSVSLLSNGGPASRWAVALTGWLIGLGVPWLGWHLRVPFAGRVAAVMFQLTGFALNGQDPRGDLWAWLADGAHVYVCGDARRMAKDVERALVDIVAQHGVRSVNEAAAFVNDLKKSGRFQQDVY